MCRCETYRLEYGIPGSSQQAALFVVVFSFFVQPVREVSCLSCALFFRGGSVPAEAKDDIMWYGFVCCSLVVHMAIQKTLLDL